MTLAPTFRIGVWNAWLLAIFWVVHPWIMSLVDKLVGAGNIRAKMGDLPDHDGQKKSIPIPSLLLIALFIFSIFLPLKTGIAWLIAGIVIYLVGIAVFLSAMITAARTPMGQIFSRGTYRYSRHPMYLSFMLIFIGISVASASWLFLVLSLGWMAFPISQLAREEQACLKVFGKVYDEYMQRTPKWIGIPRPVNTVSESEGPFT